MFLGIISDLHKKYVRGTEKGAIVHMVEVFVCNLTVAVAKGITCPHSRVYINTRVLKHIYDKRPAEEFDYLITSLHLIAKYPDKVYRNKSSKRGGFCFTKDMKGKTYLCSIEVVEKDTGHQLEIVTFFRVAEGYLRNYELIWEWKGGDLHRNAFDSGLTRPSSTPQ